MISPCTDCEKRTVTPNCHDKCDEYRDFFEKYKGAKLAQQKYAQAEEDVRVVKRRVRKLSKEIKGRAKGERR